MPLELHAQSAAERAEGGNQQRATIVRVHRDITLGEQVIAIGYSFPMARRKLRQGLTHTHMEERIHLKDRFAIGVQTRYGSTANPFVASIYLGAHAWQFSGNVRANRIVHSVPQHVAHWRVG